MIWIALFSQTGSEIVELCKQLNRKPDLILTNNFEITTGIKDLGVEVKCAKHSELMDFLLNQQYLNVNNITITLHGYLRIIPPNICSRYKIYNGHPGLITAYPELKGKDPQVRAWSGNYKWIGCVIHKVTEGVDEGPIEEQSGVPNKTTSLEEMYGLLKEMSLYLWVKFMWRLINEDSNMRSAISRKNNFTERFTV